MTVFAEAIGISVGLKDIWEGLRSGFAYYKSVRAFRQNGLVDGIHEKYAAFMDDIEAGEKHGKLSYRDYRKFYFKEHIASKDDAFRFVNKRENRSKIYEIADVFIASDKNDIECYRRVDEYIELRKMFIEEKIKDLQYEEFISAIIGYVCFRLMRSLSTGEELIVKLLENIGRNLDNAGSGLSRKEIQKLYESLKITENDNLKEKLFSHLLFYVYSNDEVNAIINHIFRYSMFHGMISFVDKLEYLAFGDCKKPMRIFGNVARDVFSGGLGNYNKKDLANPIASLMWLVAACHSYSSDEKNCIRHFKDDVRMLCVDFSDGEKIIQNCREIINDRESTYFIIPDAIISPRVGKQYEGYAAYKYYSDMPVETGGPHEFEGDNSEYETWIVAWVGILNNKTITEYDIRNNDLSKIVEEANALLEDMFEDSGLPRRHICIFNSIGQVNRLTNKLKKKFPLLLFVLNTRDQDDYSTFSISDIDAWLRNAGEIYRMLGGGDDSKK